jgi:hypothetical protein
LFRRDGDELKRTSVEMDTMLKPDDVLIIEVPLPEIPERGD